MSIKPVNRSQPEIEQLSIWSLLERLEADPLDANIIDLSNWIGSLDLESGGDALVTWGISFRNRAIQLLDEWQLKSPLTPAELIEPPFDVSIFDDLVLGRMEWDLGDLVETIEADYPSERQAAPAIALVSKNAALELADLQIALDKALGTAHGEEIELWASRIQAVMIECGEILLVELQERSGLDLVDLWLGLLLGDTGCVVSRQLSEDVDFNVDFYDRAGIWIVEFITNSPIEME
jgi:hypothetical protein